MSEPRRVVDRAGGALLVDHLTGAHTRALLDIRVAEELDRARRAGSSCSVCLIDIDQLKSVNDAFGHARGDEVLRAVVDRVSGQLRNGDVIFRYGGDEFVLLLPGTGKSEAAEVALRVLDAVGATPLAGDPALQLSISLGVAAFPADAADPAGLVAVADARTYVAKRRGRGCVAVDDEGEAAVAAPRLLERHAPMAAAQSFLADLVGGRPGELRVVGPRGAGFTRFVGEVADLAALRGLEVLKVSGDTPPAHGSGPSRPPSTSDRQRPSPAPPGLVVVADGEAVWAPARQLAMHRLADGNPVGLLLAGPARANAHGGGPVPLRATVELSAWSADAVRVWLRTRLRGEPSAVLIEHLRAVSDGLPARAERALARLLDGDALQRLPGGWTLRLTVPAKQRHRLPVPATELVGRGVEIDQLIGVLGNERLVTLTGTGGIGKTRLALAVADAVADRYADGTVFVSLAEATTPAHVEAAVAQALQVTEVRHVPLTSTIAEHLAERELLLILDNFEQVTPAGGQLAAWLSAARQVNVLVTSRERLRLPAEHVYALPGLTLPSCPGTVAGRAVPAEAVAQALAQSSALELFAARAQRVAYDFALTAHDLPTMVELCRWLDGLPLAIELAAAHVDTLTPEQLLARLAGRLDLLDLLGDGPHDMPPRQQTLRATIGWSYDLLDPADRRLFTALGVFAGGCRLDAVAAVCPIDRPADRLAGLVDKSLLQMEADPDGEPRFALLETIRTYAGERLADSADLGSTRTRHRAH